MRATEIKCVELEGTEDGILEILEITNWSDFGEERARVYRLWIDERYYRDMNVSIEEVA